MFSNYLIRSWRTPRGALVIISRLDEKWVEEGLRYLLIRALIETVGISGESENAKIVISLRYDLIDRVIRMSLISGSRKRSMSPFISTRTGRASN